MRHLILVFVCSFICLASQAQSYVVLDEYNDIKTRVSNFDKSVSSVEQGKELIESRKQIIRGLRYISSGFNNFNNVDDAYAKAENLTEKQKYQRDFAIENGAYPIQFNPGEKEQFIENIADMKAVKSYFKGQRWDIDPDNAADIDQLRLFSIAAKSCITLQDRYVK